MRPRPRPLFAVSLAAASLAAAAAAPAHADTEALSVGLGPREIAVGEARRADASGALAFTLNPAGLPLTRELVFEGGYGYRDSDGASVATASACDSTVAAPGCFYYQYVSASPVVDGTDHHRRAHVFGATLSRRLAPLVTVGIGSKYFDYNSDLEEGDSDGFSFDAGLMVQPHSLFNLAVVGYNVIGDDSPQFPRGVGGGVAFHAGPSVGISLDGVWNLDLPDGDSTGRYGGGLEYFVSSGDRQTGYPLRVGAVYDNHLGGTFVTAGVGLASVKLGIDVGGRFQVDGGDEVAIVGSLRIFGPRGDVNSNDQSGF
jgi:hypothetical protein